MTADDYNQTINYHLCLHQAMATTVRQLMTVITGHGGNIQATEDATPKTPSTTVIARSSCWRATNVTPPTDFIFFSFYKPTAQPELPSTRIAICDLNYPTGAFFCRRRHQFCHHFWLLSTPTTTFHRRLQFLSSQLVDPSSTSPAWDLFKPISFPFQTPFTQLQG